MCTSGSRYVSNCSCLVDLVCALTSNSNTCKIIHNLQQCNASITIYCKKLMTYK